MGVGDLYFHRIAPVSASMAVTQPPHISFGSFRPNRCCGSPEPAHGRPRVPVTVAASASFTEAHQSTEFTIMRFNCGWKAGPFHSVPPWVPGQKCVSAAVFNGVSTFSRVVTGVEYRIFSGDCDGFAPAFTLERSIP